MNCIKPAILIMTITYPVSVLGGRIIRFSGLQDQLSNIKLMRCSQLSKQKYVVSAFISSNKRLREGNFCRSRQNVSSISSGSNFTHPHLSFGLFDPGFASCALTVFFVCLPRRKGFFRDIAEIIIVINRLNDSQTYIVPSPVAPLNIGFYTA